MCAGVQNVSLPIDMCQEMSQSPPTIPDAIPATMHQIVHGIDVASARAAVRSPTPTPSCVPTGMLCPIGLLSSPPSHYRALPSSRPPFFYDAPRLLYRPPLKAVRNRDIPAR